MLHRSSQAQRHRLAQARRGHRPSGCRAARVTRATIEGSRVVTIFAIGKLNEAQKPLKALICQDNAAPAGGKTVCATAP